MNPKEKLWTSFSGCFIAVGHYVISVLAGVATWYLMRSLAFPPFVVWMTAVSVGMVTFQVVYIIKFKIGAKS